MRLWTLHPKYLDTKGLVALWREALLAQKVLQGRTKGYRHHPQLARFKAHKKPVAVLAVYLRVVHEEASRRGYKFDSSKIARQRSSVTLTETVGQLRFEWQHLRRKLKRRASQLLAMHKDISNPDPHPLFKIIAGDVRDWEAVAKPSTSRKPKHSTTWARPRRDLAIAATVSRRSRRK